MMFMIKNIKTKVTCIFPIDVGHVLLKISIPIVLKTTSEEEAINTTF